MSEAKKRNPKVRTYVLSWGVPGWVGNGSYFSPANIHYQTSFVKGARDVYNISVDYLGICGRTDPHSALPPAAPAASLRRWLERLLTACAALQGTSGRGATWST